MPASGRKQLFASFGVHELQYPLPDLPIRRQVVEALALSERVKPEVHADELEVVCMQMTDTFTPYGRDS